MDRAYFKRDFWQDSDVGLLVLRINLGVLLFLHGWYKVLHGIEMPMSRLINHGVPGQLMYFAYISEFIAPILLILGVFTRLSAASIVLTMITVLYILDFPIFGIDDHGVANAEVQWFYLLTALTLFFTGSGRLALRSNKDGHWLLE